MCLIFLCIALEMPSCRLVSFWFACFELSKSDSLFRLNVLRAYSLCLFAKAALTSSNARIRLDELHWPMQLNSQLISVNQNTRLRLEEPIDILQCSVCSLRVQEVCDRYETKTDNRPDNPELVPEILNSWKRCLHYCIIANPVRAALDISRYMLCRDWWHRTSSQEMHLSFASPKH